MLLNKLQLTASLFRSDLVTKVIPVKFIHSSFTKYDETNQRRRQQKLDSEDYRTISNSKDRSVIVPVETSIEYLKSDAYKETYGNDPVWKHYRRNFKGQIPPQKTRKICIRGNVVSTGSPCPICRDEYLIVDYRNIDLIKQFISEYSGEILDYNYTCVCQKAYKNLCIAIMKAKEYGLLTYDVPFRHYNYSEWKQ